VLEWLLSGLFSLEQQTSQAGKLLLAAAAAVVVTGGGAMEAKTLEMQ
jgi:hypothetical protein